MSGLRLIALSVVLLCSTLLLTPRGQAAMVEPAGRILSAIELECKQMSRIVDGIEVSCNIFADVRKLDMRRSNRSNSAMGSPLVQIKN